MIINEVTIIISLIAFLAVVGLIEGFYLLYRSMNVERTQAVSKRLRNLSASGLSNEEALSLLRRRTFSEVPALTGFWPCFPVPIPWTGCWFSPVWNLPCHGIC